MRRHIYIVTLIALIVVAIVLLVVFAKPLGRIYGSIKIVEAIKKGDIAEIGKSLQKEPSAVNSPATYVPNGLYVLLTDHHVPYPLIEACYTDNIEIVKLLVEAGADVNCYNGTTPLSVVYRSKKENWYEISQYLIENGASLDYITSNSGGTSIGTYNYSPSGTFWGSIGHFFADMLPWYLFGNDDDDPGPLANEIIRLFE